MKIMNVAIRVLFILNVAAFIFAVIASGGVWIYTETAVLAGPHAELLPDLARLLFILTICLGMLVFALYVSYHNARYEAERVKRAYKEFNRVFAHWLTLTLKKNRP
jgi:hypothetical protein